MRIAIASGKGGAGKTAVTASLSRVWPASRIMVDTDVEAPNLHLFLHPVFGESEQVYLSIPQRVTENCTGCGRCREMCHYSAIARFGKKIVLFPDMCHGCGGCFAVCPEGSLVQGKRELGSIACGCLPDGGPYLNGRTRIGEVMTPPLLRRLLQKLTELEKSLPDTPDVLLDSPPGVSCPAVTVAGKADALLMVIDPSPFGYHDFVLAHSAFSSLGLPLACVLNRAGLPGNADGDAAVRRYCKEHELPLIGELPFERVAAQAYASGKVLADISEQWSERFQKFALALRSHFQEVLHA